MLGVGVTELGLVKYLLEQLALSEGERVDSLREFAPAQSIPIGSWTSRASAFR